MHKILAFLLCITLTGLHFSILAQTNTTANINSKQKKEIIQNISRLLNNSYVYEDTAKKMSTRIQESMKTGKYDKINEPTLLADKIQQDLHSVYRDGHIIVQYNPRLAAELSGRTNAYPTQPERVMPTVTDRNYGFQKAEILNGNIGYINLVNFSCDGEEGMKAIKATLGFVSNANAIIIDVRNNGGGSQAAATNLMGFFFAQPTHVESFYNRSENDYTHYKTTPQQGFERLHDMPLYILTSNKTFSCGEMLPYDLQALKRAIVIGETTGGGAHGQFEADAGNGFVIQIPYWRAINPITKSNWEYNGVQPDIKVPANEALETAEVEIFKTMVANAKTEGERFRLNWQMDMMRAINHAAVIDEAILQQYAGVYEQRTFTLENGKFYYQRTGRPKFEMEAMTPTTMRAKGNDYFKIEFSRNDKGIVDKVTAYYQDMRVEHSKKSK